MNQVSQTEVAEKMVAALQNPCYDFRIPHGIAEEVGVSEGSIEECIRNNPYLVRGPLSPDPYGRKLVTLRSRWPKLREILACIRYYTVSDV